MLDSTALLKRKALEIVNVADSRGIDLMDFDISGVLGLAANDRANV